MDDKTNLKKPICDPCGAPLIQFYDSANDLGFQAMCPNCNTVLGSIDQFDWGTKPMISAFTTEISPRLGHVIGRVWREDVVKADPNDPRNT